MKPKLSCIIITLNEEEWLPKLLDSLKSQSFQDFEIIVADYNSKDKTREIAKEYGCRVVRGGTYSSGRNNGAKAAKADYLLFLDADCILPQDFLLVNYYVFERIGAGTATVPLLPISDRRIDKILYKTYDYWSRLMYWFSPHCAGCGIFAKKEIFKKIGGFNEKIVFAENHDFTRRAKKYGFVILPRPIYTSVRRLDKDGRFKFAIKYLYAGLYRLFYKEIDKELFKYNIN